MEDDGDLVFLCGVVGQRSYGLWWEGNVGNPECH
jgi:hypothetical protein